ncbi:hypothetical protein [uncultured Bosea sp.]|uniref:hypothetical protein n=1 Tax=uncultured Bosea sp. TaxID=211457 RepID=UPI0025E8284D|nr:hypothetical protein [uncultured Bosea sp.]
MQDFGIGNAIARQAKLVPIEEADEALAADLEDDHPAGDIPQSERVTLERPGVIRIAKHPLRVDQNPSIFRPPRAVHLLQDRLGRPGLRTESEYETGQSQAEHDAALTYAECACNRMRPSENGSRDPPESGDRAVSSSYQVSEVVYAKLSSTGL